MSGKRDSIDHTKQTPSSTSSQNSSSPTKHEGPLSKWTNVVRGWQTEEDRSQTPRASIKLAGSTIVPSHEDAQTFILHASNGEVYKLKAHDVKDRQKWVNMIRCVISFSQGQRTNSTSDQTQFALSRSTTNTSFPPTHIPPSGGTVTGGGAGGGGLGGSVVRSVHFATEPASVKFDEPFAPARQVIAKIRDKRNEMCRLIEVGGDDSAVAALSPDLLLLKASSLASWDCLHQCVFALMNTDASADSGDLGIHDLSIEGDATPLTTPLITSANQTTGAPPLLANVTTPLTTSANQTAGASLFPADVTAALATPLTTPANQTTGVPVLMSAGGRDGDSAQHSRSSSVASGTVGVLTDAIDQRTPSPSVLTTSSGAPSTSPLPLGDKMLVVEGRQRGTTLPTTRTSPLPLPSAESDEEKIQTSLSQKLTPGGSLPVTSLKRQDSRPPVFSPDEEEITDVDEEDVGELGSVESEKSVILHLIGQLKIGMDLTKVTLPTFILERRSLLEMFADYLGHAYILLRISDMKTEEQRMLGVLEWYLTSLHIVRNGTQAKKPYNPIIGETFHCSYKVPNESASTNSKEGNDQLRLKYVGEQVSHHPPVTAFYAECPEKKICMSASIYTQSKFYGLSIGVNLVGTAKLFLVEFNEEYTFTLPSAYARSILTVPWCELGGKVLLQCKKSGYSADIVFHTKPFYGGKLHRVTAEVNNGQTKPVCKITGEWNSNYEFTMTQDGTQRTVDVTSLPVIKKRCRPLEKQDVFESRRLWRKVTEALKAEDIEKATFEKNTLEEIQRKGEKERKTLDVRFPNKFFHLEDGNWVFNNPLYRGTTKSAATE